MKHLGLPLLLILATALPARTAPSGDVLEVARADARLGTLVQALEAAELTDALRGTGPFTVFAPTDAAFSALPAGALEGLLRPGARDRLREVLRHHVLPGHVTADDLLPRPHATTLAGTSLGFGLTIGGAHVVQADVLCANGVIHVIDRVLMPQRPATAPTPRSRTVYEVIAQAIERGAPLFNSGDVAGCVREYQRAAGALVTHPDVSDLARMDLEAVLEESPGAPSDRAWDLRHVFDDIVANERFRPTMEADLPEGFPEPGPVGHVVVKTYPVYRAARANGANSFWTLFNHIKRNAIDMTAPVEMTMDDSMDTVDMAFLYGAPTLGETGREGRVEVADLEAVTVLSVGMRGVRSEARVAKARKAIEAAAAADGWQVAGQWRLMGYNSPMVLGNRRFWELQVPVRR